MKEIKASDLRIGNMIFFDDPVDGELINKIDWHDLKWISEDYGTFNEFHRPIPLTEEWLLRFGFEKTEWDNNNSFRKMIGNNEYTIVFYSNCHCEIGDVICKNIEYVHTLQNLYYALTSEELTINN